MFQDGQRVALRASKPCSLSSPGTHWKDQSCGQWMPTEWQSPLHTCQPLIHGRQLVTGRPGDPPGFVSTHHVHHSDLDGGSPVGGGTVVDLCSSHTADGNMRLTQPVHTPVGIAQAIQGGTTRAFPCTLGSPKSRQAELPPTIAKIGHQLPAQAGSRLIGQSRADSGLLGMDTNLPDSTTHR